MDLVVERVEPSARLLLGRPVELALKTTDLVLGVVSRNRHSPTRLLVQASMSQGPFPRAALCCRTPSSGSTAPSATLPAARRLRGAHRVYAVALRPNATSGPG